MRFRIGIIPHTKAIAISVAGIGMYHRPSGGKYKKSMSNPNSTTSHASQKNARTSPKMIDTHIGAKRTLINETIARKIRIIKMMAR